MALSSPRVWPQHFSSMRHIDEKEVWQNEWFGGCMTCVRSVDEKQGARWVNEARLGDKSDDC